MADSVLRLKVFVGSPSNCESEKALVRKLLGELNDTEREHDIPIEFEYIDWCLNVSPGVGRPQDRINEVLDQADVVTLLFWHRLGTDAGAGQPGTIEEFNRTLEKARREGKPELLLFFKEEAIPFHDLDPAQFTALRQFRQDLESRVALLYRTFETDAELLRSLRQALVRIANRTRRNLANSVDPTTISRPSEVTPWSITRKKYLPKQGFDSVGRVFDPQFLEGRVLAAELLTRNIEFRRDGQKRIVRIDRTGVQDAIYTGPARRLLNEACFDSDVVRDWAKTLDSRVHDFLRGVSNEGIIVPVDALPIRWASGGVFQLVTYREKQYVSFFFRDIWPMGWNICLGGSELGDNLLDPWSFLWREFLEEFLILRSSPSQGKAAVRYRPPAFSDNPDLVRPQLMADRFSDEHRVLRKTNDKISLTPDWDRPLELDTSPTGVTVEVLRQPGAQATWSNNFFVAFNPFELGIEIVAPVRYTLSDGDYPLDGEILKPEGTPPQLVRMPVALISFDYLRRNFADPFKPLQYDDADSIVGDEFRDGELLVFDWDIRRRLELAANELPNDAEGDRHRTWRKLFGSAFEAHRKGQGIDLELRKFTATSAKIASYYFSAPSDPEE